MDPLLMLMKALALRKPPTHQLCPFSTKQPMVQLSYLSSSCRTLLEPSVPVTSAIAAPTAQLL